MRFFATACLFCLMVASVGCMTKNWSSPIFKNRPIPTESEESFDTEEPAKNSMMSEARNFWKGSFGQRSGMDSRAREIEKRLGY